MVTIQQALKEAQSNFPSSETAALDAELLLAHILNCTRTVLHTWPERDLSATNYQHYQQISAKRAAGVPVAYLLGQQAFWKFNLQVTPDVLIPRPETEILVEVVLKLPLSDAIKIADLGTGSGAIAIALAFERPHWQIVATDKSMNALVIAKNNAEFLQLLNIDWLESDWYTALAEQKFQLIVSNPPYIAPQDPHLTALGYEPAHALIAEQNGMADLAKIIQGASTHLLPGGYLVVEHGYQQAKIVQEMFLTTGFHDIEMQLDLTHHPRVTWGQWC